MAANGFKHPAPVLPAMGVHSFHNDSYVYISPISSNPLINPLLDPLSQLLHLTMSLIISTLDMLPLVVNHLQPFTPRHTTSCILQLLLPLSLDHQVAPQDLLLNVP
jgi:hypothetical protein